MTYGSSTSGMANTRHVADVPNCSAKLMVSFRAWSLTSRPHASSPCALQLFEAPHLVQQLYGTITHVSCATGARGRRIDAVI